MLTLLSVNGQKFRGEGYVALRSSNLLLQFSFNFHQLTDREPSGSEKDKRQCYCNTHEDVLNLGLISLVKRGLNLNSVSPDCE